SLFFFFFKQKTAYEMATRLEFRRVLFRSRRGHRDRRAARGEGAGREPRRKIPRGRGRGVQTGGDRGRLRQGNVERVSGQAGRAQIGRASCRERGESAEGEG